MSNTNPYAGRKIWFPYKWIEDEFWLGRPEELVLLFHLIGRANYKDSKFARGNTVITVKRGECVFSHRSLASKVGWDKSRIAPFLKKYSELDYIQTETRQGIPVVTICNYNEMSKLIDNRPDENQTRTRREPDKNQTNHSKGSKDSVDNTVSDFEFEKFWEDYPRLRRGNKSKSKKAYLRAVKEKRGDAEEIYSGLQLYIQSDPGQYAKGCEAWLNNDGWTHEYVPRQKMKFSELILNVPHHKRLGVKRMIHNREDEHAFRQATGYGFSDIQYP